MKMARPRRVEKTKEIGGIRIAQNRVPGWLLIVIVGVIAWGLYYMITYTVTDTGTFQAPAAFLRL
jgi:hypothetical protein